MASTNLALDFHQTTQCDQTMQPVDKKHIRLVVADDLPVIASWWRRHRKDELVPSMLSTLGVMIEGEAVGFLYETNSPRCFADFCIVNPALPKKERGRAIEMLMDSLMGVAAGRGFKTMEITVRNQSLLSRCKAKGFIELGEVTYLGKRLCLAS